MNSAPDPHEGRPLPSVIYNPVTMAGGALAGLSLGLILFLMLLELMTSEPKPYMGVLAFVIMPVFLIMGLLLVALGAWREHRRRKRGAPPRDRLPRIDLNEARHRRAVAIFGFGTVVLLVLSAFGSFKAYEYTDSNEFCGETCHVLMQPEFTAYKVSAHARVNCIECHIGPGAQWFVRSKLSGAYQVYATLADKYPRPIPTPIKNLRPSRDTCEQCHWPAHFYHENLVVTDYYMSDEENTHWKLDLLMKIGGGSAEEGPASGIHWHMNVANEVSYVATDERRQEIPWVRSVDRDGNETIFRSTEIEFDEEMLAEAEIRQMDCIDCHNRPSHNYDPAPMLINKQMALGHIDPSIPEIKTLLVDLMEDDYETQQEGLDALEAGIREHLSDLDLDGEGPMADQVVQTAQRLYGTNYFPEMKVRWDAFPDNIGHLYSPGCFRCHDGLHKSDDGRVISRDCNVCHTILAQETVEEGQRVALGGVEYRHPEDIDEEWKETNCSECHGP